MSLVSKHWKPRRQTVELRPSRIRRDPVRLDTKVEPESPERERWTAIVGVVLIAAACAALILGLSEVTSRFGAAAAPATDGPRFGHCYNASASDCIVDGDTIVIGGRTVDIAGIEAPAVRNAACARERSRGIAAAVRLHELLNRGEVTMVGAPKQDRDGRLVAKIEVNGRDVGLTMVASGLAREIVGERTGWC